MNPSLAHETITIDRTIKASPEIVFEAWAKPEARAIWGVPSEDEALEFIENDFRAGGMDVHMCGQKGDLRFRVETLYHEIQGKHPVKAAGFVILFSWRQRLCARAASAALA